MKHSGETGLKDAKPEAPEYGFEKGLEEITSRILELLRREKYVVVAFSCSSTNVGKSTLAKAIGNSLFSRGVVSWRYHGLEETRSAPPPREDSRVFIFEQLNWFPARTGEQEDVRRLYDKNIAEALSGLNVEVRGVDLWVGIHSPEKEFSRSATSRPLADIIVCNEMAKRKKV